LTFKVSVFTDVVLPFTKRLPATVKLLERPTLPEESIATD
jgi:hypothetical protein